MVKKKATIYVWTGIGAGKTTSSLGVALREVGHGNNVIIIQFMKGRKDIGEYKIKKRLSPEYEIYQFGRTGWVNLKNPSLQDKKLAQQGLEFAKKAAKKKPDLLVLDELNLVLAYGLLDTNEVLKFLDTIPPKTSVYITGRFAPLKLMERADYVTEFVTLKRPSEIIAKKGIEY
ncbi:cob(I)yrinic acid a,c-diamide adenosyltransferase [Candidatus Woesearchaeota archaeon]|nr:cob(I)yrinic acid a,c-diamide adenosyltransferase [Candidatus Woesearchaeota archaeon]